MSVFRRDQHSNSHGHRGLFSFCTRFGLEPTYTALERACRKVVAKLERLGRLAAPFIFQSFWFKGFRFSLWAVPGRHGGKRETCLIPAMDGWGLGGRERER